MAFLTPTAIRIQVLIDEVTDPARGAIVSFLGLVRDHHEGRRVSALAYTAYEPMAEGVSADIVTEAESRWPVRVALRHRVGALVIGDAAVAVVAAGDHRDEAFRACQYVIEELKRRVPIWKQETYADGSVLWVDPTAAPTAIVESEVSRA